MEITGCDVQCGQDWVKETTILFDGFQNLSAFQVSKEEYLSSRCPNGTLNENTDLLNYRDQET